MGSAELWPQVLATPGDEKIRARYMEVLVEEGDRRAEALLVGAEIGRRRANHESHRTQALEKHCENLTRIAGAGFAAITEKWQAKLKFVLGWPSELTMTASAFAKYAAEIAGTLPLRHLNLTSINEMPEAFDVPQFSQIASLQASGQVWSNKSVRALTASRYVRDLRWLDLSKTGLGDKQVEMLAAAENLRGLAQIDLSQNPCRDPVDASLGCGYDGITGGVVLESIFLPEFGRELQGRYGEIRWLNVLYQYAEYPLSRYRF